MSFTANSTGGEFKHKLSVSEMPSHYHKQTIAAGNGNNAGFQRYDYTGEGNGNLYPANHNTGNAGDDGSHNNVQPYITVYFWRRTA